MYFVLLLLFVLCIYHIKKKSIRNSRSLVDFPNKYVIKISELDSYEKLENRLNTNLNFKVDKYNSCKTDSLRCGLMYEGRKKITTKFTPHNYLLPFPVKLNIIIQPKSKCRENEKLIIAITCSPGSFMRRHVYRKIYNQYSFIKYYFFTTKSVKQKVNDLIKEENNKYDDIIQYDFTGGYYLITLQVIGAIRWIKKRCKNYKYLVDHQSDIFFNIPFYLKMFDNDITHPVIGNLYLKPLVCRSVNYVSYMPKKYYKDDYYPPFVQGPCILFSEDTINKLEKASYVMDKVICFDDVYIGLLINYSRIDVNKIKCIEKYKRDEYRRSMKKSYIKNRMLWIHGLQPAAIYYLSMN